MAARKIEMTELLATSLIKTGCKCPPRHELVENPIILRKLLLENPIAIREATQISAASYDTLRQYVYRYMGKDPNTNITLEEKLLIKQIVLNNVKKNQNNEKLSQVVVDYINELRKQKNLSPAEPYKIQMYVYQIKTKDPEIKDEARKRGISMFTSRTHKVNVKKGNVESGSKDSVPNQQEDLEKYLDLL
ncbi:Hypothetical_protein [Hexamita inflata]|uniref:Hypothetical_protein n=1 Tax=Hexamita inflata TaxID=28002 RepID=A0AA86Q741_9EUKA|nr:Hypothetical protein HINF_LOCUS34809 [Hexamita inflata]